jgi:hypothetical protein
MTEPSQPSQQHSVEYVTLKEYFERLITEQNRSINVARESMEKRLDSMNEFRATLKDQSATLVSLNTFNAWKDKTDSDIRELRDSKAKLEGKADQSQVNRVSGTAMFGLFIGGAGLAISLFSFLRGLFVQ